MSSNFPGGVTNVVEADPMGQYLAPDPTQIHEWFNDFDTYTAGDWTVTETQAGATQAIVAGDGGLLALVNSAADDDLNQIQLATETFLFSSTKRFWIKSRFKVSNATESDILVGVYVTDTTPVASAPSDGLYFSKTDGSTTLQFKASKASATTTTTVATVVADTFIVVTAYYNGVDTIYLYADGNLVGSSVSTNIPTAQTVAIGIAIQNGDANARTLTVDYLLVAEER